MLLPAHDGALYLLNELDTYEPTAIWGTQPALNATYTSDSCWALRRGKPYRFGVDQSNPPCSHLGSSAPRHTLCIPLSAQGESFGNLLIASNEEKSAGLMNAEEQLFIETAASSIALALANLRLREKLRLQSIRDALTGLYNRRYLDDILPREINRANRNEHPLSILLFDIDHFKDFNDTHGHNAGDFVLQNLAEMMLSIIRESDIACRYGGEEFMVILPNTSLEIAQKRAETLRQEISQNTLKFMDKLLGAITVSIGVAAYPQHGEQAGALIKSADEALYQAKQNGRNRVMVSV
jgi:diguanylate cyclase (GGDEF)-like protein